MSTGVRAQVRTDDGWAVRHAVLTVTDSAGQQVAHVPADTDGMVVTQPLPAGSYIAILTAVGYVPAARTAVVTASGSAALGTVTLHRDGGVELPPPGMWTIDPAHSTIAVAAHHLGMSSVKGRFTDFSGRIQVREPVESSSVSAVIQAASIDTANKMRDDHLRSPDFLDCEVFPIITFISHEITPKGPDSWTVAGALSLHGVTRPVVLDLRYGGTGPDPWGGTRAAFHATTELHRSDFAIDYNAMVRVGIAAIGTTLKVELDIQAVQGSSLPEM
jgi:polyisoprenoid-binding protein YceI